MTTIHEIAEPMARTLWLCAYADGIENEEIEGPAPGAQEDWDDYAPPTPPEALTKALEVLQGIKDPVAIAERWMQDTGQDVERFGHCLALQVLGHGVGLGDDYPTATKQPKVDLPYAEFYLHDVDLSQIAGVFRIEGEE